MAAVVSLSWLYLGVLVSASGMALAVAARDPRRWLGLGDPRRSARKGSSR